MIDKKADLTGQIFGQLSVIKFDKSVPKNGKYWICRCDCGRSEDFSVLATKLFTGKIISCHKCGLERGSYKQYINLTGMKFGKITVVRFDRFQKGAFWVCKCECGRLDEFVVSSVRLTSGETTSCKFCGYDIIAEKKFKDLTGSKFGKLTVISLYKKEQINGYTNTWWLCSCDCGRNNEFVIKVSSLKNDGHNMCDVCRKEKHSRIMCEDLTGMVFGKLTVIERGEDYVTPKGYHSVRWFCRCSCGNNELILVKAKSLRSGYTSSCGCLSESVIASELKKYCVDKYFATTEYKIMKNPITGCWLRTDIYIPSNKIYVEVMGIQHYEVCKFHYSKKSQKTPEEALEYQIFKDDLKKDFAKANGIYIEIDLRIIKNVTEAIIYLDETIKDRLNDLNVELTEPHYFSIV